MKKIMLATSDAWSMSPLSQLATKPAYYIVDYRILSITLVVEFQLSFIFYIPGVCHYVWFYLRHLILNQKKRIKIQWTFFLYNTIVETDSTYCTVPRFALNLKISKPLTRKTIVLKLSLLTENLHWSSTLIKIHGNGAF